LKFIRIGNKTVSLEKILLAVEDILEMRGRGFSQQDIAEKIGIDRSFVSRLECIGEIRKGQSVGFIAFPVKNKSEVIKLIGQYGVDFHIVMTEEERNTFVKEKSGVELLNSVMGLITEARNLDTIIVFASDKRGRLIEALLDCQVIRKDIGQSPITSDVYVSLDEIKQIFDALQLTSNL